MMGLINSVGISHHTMRLLIVKSGRMSYDDQLQSLSWGFPLECVETKRGTAKVFGSKKETRTV